MTETDRPPYNNERFKIKNYDWDLFRGPHAGDQAPGFTVTDLETGEAVSLSDYRGRWLVIETGSSTCSMYTKNIPGMDDLRSEYPDVDFVVIYVREAHPGERLHQHKNFDEKVSAAKLLKPRYSEHRRVLVDDHAGSFHQPYGMKPNFIYVIRPDGVVHYRCDWAHIDGLREALNDRENLHTLEHADIDKLHAARGMGIAIRTMWTGGLIALWDFFAAGPELVKRHKFEDEYYEKHGRFRNE
ncbi:MAG: deiodinase-like protein [Gammaproteobacteria bacterium]